VVLSVDEKTAIAARSRRHPGQAPRPGLIARQEFEYRRHGTVSPVALDARSGQILTETITRNNAATFTAFLDRLEAVIDPSKEIHIALDNGPSHTAKHTRTWLTRPPALARALHTPARLLTEPDRAVLLSPDPSCPAERRIPQSRRPHRHDGHLRPPAQQDREAIALDIRRHPAQHSLINPLNELLRGSTTAGFPFQWVYVLVVG